MAAIPFFFYSCNLIQRAHPAVISRKKNVVLQESAWNVQSAFLSLSLSLLFFSVSILVRMLSFGLNPGMKYSETTS